GVVQINDAMEQLNQLTQNNASSSEELSATAEEMSAQAEELQRVMAFFKLDAGAGDRSAKFAPSDRGSVASTARPAHRGTKGFATVTERVIDESEFERF